MGDRHGEEGTGALGYGDVIASAEYMTEPQQHPANNMEDGGNEGGGDAELYGDVQIEEEDDNMSMWEDLLNQEEDEDESSEAEGMIVKLVWEV